MPPKSKWRSDDAQHFTLVHRSQRDPLIHDPDAPSRVLAPTQRRAAGKLSRKELEEDLKRKGLEQDRANVGEAAEYGVYFDDTQYDYMQHLRAIGGDYNSKRGGKDEEVDVDVVMLPGPDKGKEKAKAGGELEFKDDAPKTVEEKRLQLPREVLASQQEFARDWSRGTDEAGGLRLDMDPHLRQALEALDDEAFLVGKAKQRQREAAVARAAAQAASQQQAESSASGSNAISFDGDDDGDDDDDFDALFSEVIAGGKYDPTSGEADDEWRQLPPGGDEALYLTPAEKAQQKMQQAQVGGVDQAEVGEDG
jgi:protein LTV1